MGIKRGVKKPVLILDEDDLDSIVRYRREYKETQRLLEELSSRKLGDKDHDTLVEEKYWEDEEDSYWSNDELSFYNLNEVSI